MARSFVIALGILALAGMHASAQDSPPRGPSLRDLPLELVPPRSRQDQSPSGKNQQKLPEPAAKAEKTPPPAPVTLDSLYERLAKAKDRMEASAISKQIERRWLRSGSDTTDLLMTRATQAMSAKQPETALELFDHILQLKPEWAEAYHQRATTLFQMRDYDGALRDLRQALAREPRHYSALSGLGMIMHQLDNKKAAFAAFSKALELHPNLENLKGMVERLRPEAEGQKL